MAYLPTVNPDRLLSLVKERLAALEMSAAAASTRAVGNHYLIRNIERRRRWPSVESLIALCRVLDLEFYVGPKREASAPVAQRPLEGSSPPLDRSWDEPPGGPMLGDLSRALADIERMASSLLVSRRSLGEAQRAEVEIVRGVVSGLARAYRGREGRRLAPPIEREG